MVVASAVMPMHDAPGGFAHSMPISSGGQPPADAAAAQPTQPTSSIQEVSSLSHAMSAQLHLLNQAPSTHHTPRTTHRERRQIKMDGDAVSSGELLLLLLDTSLLRAAATYGLQVDLFLQQLLIFLRAHQLLSEHNHQAIMALTHSSSPVLLTPDSLAERGSAALPALLVGRLTRLLEHEAAAAVAAGEQQQQQQQQPADPPEVALSAGLSRALCYVNRFSERYGANARHRAKPRLLALMGACDMPLQYIPVMNAIFAAQAAGVVLDALLLGQADSAFLQQATHLTGGLYVRATQPAGLLQYLLGAFSADSATREALSISGSSQVVDYRASCFCHKTIIDTGYICSVCLSIFCKANMKAPQCLTCGAPFTKGAAAAQAAAAAAAGGGGGGSNKGGQNQAAAAAAGGGGS